MALRDSAIELVLKLKNLLGPSADQAAAELEAVGDKARQLDSQLSTLEQQQAAITAFRALGDAAGKSGKELSELNAEAARLKGELKTSPTPELALALERVKAEATETRNAFRSTVKEQSSLGRALRSAGIDTRELAAAEDKLNAELAQTRAAAAQAASGLAKFGNDADKAGGQLGKTRAGVESISTQLALVKTQLIGAFGVAQVGRFLTSTLDAAEAWKSYQARLKLATDSQTEFNRATAGTFEIAQRTGTEVGQVGNLYARLTQATEKLGLTQKAALKITEDISRAIQISGGTAETAAAAIQQLSQGLASGVLRGDEFNSVMENSPRLARALADGIGVGVGELRKMAEQGKLTADVVTKALQSQSGVIAKEFATLPNTIGKATARLSNEWQKLLGDFDKTHGVTEGVAKGLEAVAKNLDEIATVAGIAGAIAVQVLLVRMVPAILSTAASFRTMGASAVAGFAQANAAASAGSVGIIGKMKGMAAGIGGVFAGLSQAFKANVILFAIQSVVLDLYKLYDATRQLITANKELALSQKAKAEQTQLLGAELTELNARTGLHITTVKQLHKAYADGTLIWSETTKRYETAAVAAQHLAQQQAELAAAAQTPAAVLARTNKAFLELTATFEKTQSAGKNLEAGLSAMLEKVSQGGVDDVRGFGSALRTLELQGKATGDELAQGLAGAIGKLNNADYSRFKNGLAEALKGGAQAATNLQTIIEADLLAALQALGVNGAQALNTLSKATKTNIAAFETLARSGQVSAQTLRNAFRGALSQAQSQADIDALIAKVTELGKAGQISGEVSAEANALATARQADLKQAVGETLTAEERLAQFRREELERIKNDKVVEDNDDIERVTRRVGHTQAEADAKIAIRKTQYEQNKEIEKKEDEDYRQRSDALSSFFMSHINEAANRLAKLSDEARAAYMATFQNTQAAGRETLDVAVNTLAEISSRAADVSAEVGKAQQQLLRSQNTVFQYFAVKQKLASLSIEKAFYEQMAQAKSLLDELDNVDSATAGTVSRAEEALESFDLLGDEQLEPLRRAIEDTRDQFRELADEIRQESADLQDELDRLRGNEAAIAERRFADRIKGLQDQLSEARRSNDRDLQTRAEENIRLLEQIRAAELAQEQADKQSGTNGSPRENNVTPLPVRAPAPSRTVRVQLQTADRESNLDLPDDQAEALIRQLEILNRSTGPRT